MLMGRSASVGHEVSLLLFTIRCRFLAAGRYATGADSGAYGGAEDEIVPSRPALLSERLVEHVCVFGGNDRA